MLEVPWDPPLARPLGYLSSGESPSAVQRCRITCCTVVSMVASGASGTIVSGTLPGMVQRFAVVSISSSGHIFYICAPKTQSTRSNSQVWMGAMRCPEPRSPERARWKDVRPTSAAVGGASRRRAHFSFHERLLGLWLLSSRCPWMLQCARRPPGALGAHVSLSAHQRSSLTPSNHCQFDEYEAITPCSFSLHFLMTSDFENFFHVCWPLGYVFVNRLFISFCSFTNYWVISFSCRFSKRSAYIIAISPLPRYPYCKYYLYNSFIY